MKISTDMAAWGFDALLVSALGGLGYLIWGIDGVMGAGLVYLAFFALVNGINHGMKQ